MQLIRAFDLLDKELTKDVYVLYLGSNQETDYNIQEVADKSSSKTHFIFCGNVDKELVPQYYLQGNSVVLMSVSEGFGLSLIEGLHFGLPCMSFTDVDAFEDIYDEDVMIGVKDHTDSAVAEGLEELITKGWNYNRINEYSHKFEPLIMAKRYIDEYKRVLQDS